MFDFLNFAAMLLLLLIPLLVVLRKIKLFSPIVFPLTLSDWKGKSFSWNSKLRTFLSFVSKSCNVIAFVCAIIALADPVIHHQEKVYTSKGADILFVLDTSPSMAAKDINGMTRLQAACIAVKTLVSNNDGASYGLVAMGSEAALVVPSTMDENAFLERVNSLVIGKLGDGTAIGTGLSLAVYHLSASKAKEKCIILITDGENNAGEIHPETAAMLAKEKKITLYTLGVGTQGSVPLEYTDPITGKFYSGYLDSKFDSTPLERIATVADGRYFGVETISSLSNSLSLIIKRHNVIQTYYLRNIDNRLYSKFLLASLILFLLSWAIRYLYLKEFL